MGEVCDSVWDQECTDKPCGPVTETINKIEKERVGHPEECHTVPQEVCTDVTETVCEAATKVCHNVWMSGGECGREIVCEKELGKECKTVAQKWKRSLKWSKAKKDKKICWPAKVEKCYWAPKNCLKEVCKDVPACHQVTKPSCSLVDRKECVPAREVCVDVTKQVQVQSIKHCPVPPQQDCREVEKQVCKNVIKTDWVCSPVCKAVERQECQPGQPGPDVCTSVWRTSARTSATVSRSRRKSAPLNGTRSRTLSARLSPRLTGSAHLSAKLLKERIANRGNLSKTAGRYPRPLPTRSPRKYAALSGESYSSLFLNAKLALKLK